jgi:hypothetical protein
VTCGSWCSSGLNSWRALRMLLAIGLVMGATLSASAQQPTSEQISAIRASCRSDFMSNCTGVKPGTRDALECLKRNAAKVSPACKTALDAISPRPTESAAPAAAKPAPPTAAAASPPPAAAAPSPPAAAASPPPAAAAAPPPSAAAEPPAASAEPGARPAPGPAAGEGKKHPSPQVAAVRATCHADFGVHCPGVKPGGSAALHCLQANAAALSPPCRNAVMAMGEAGAPPAASAPPAPLGPIPPMRPRKALEVLSFCGAEQRTLCANVPPGGGRILECLAANYARLSPECYGALARAAR